MTDPEERIVEIEERSVRGWYMPSDVTYLLEVARAAKELVEGQDRGGAEVTLRKGMDHLRDALTADYVALRQRIREMLNELEADDGE